MEQTQIFLPFLGTLLLTMFVWIYMYIRRIGYMVKNNIPAQAGATPERMKQLIPETVATPANNLMNLFELPVVFYAICLYLLWSQQVDSIHVVCSYVFFIGRTIHSIIQCTVNHVMSRFTVYVISSIALWTMVVRAACHALL